MKDSDLVSVNDKEKSVTTRVEGELLPKGSPAPLARVIHNLQPQAVAQAERLRRAPFLYSFIIMVMLPSLIAAFYLGIYASPRYTTEFRAAVRSVEQPKSGGLTAMLGMTGMPGASQSGNDSYAVVQYLQSREAVDQLQSLVPLRSFYERSDIDWFSRLSRNQPIERVVKYWRGMLNAYYEMSTGTIVVNATAFTPQESLVVAKNALELSEKLVNRMSTRVRDDTVAVAEGQVARAEKRLQDATEQLRVMQNKFSVIDPKKAAENTLALTSKLRDQLIRLKAEFAVQSSYMNENAPSLRFTKEQISSLEAEISKLNSQITTSSTADRSAQPPLSGVIGSFSHLESERSFAEKSYQNALAYLDGARIEALRQQTYLETIVRPALPQQQSFPRFLVNFCEVIGVAIVIWLLSIFVVHSIREHI